MANQILLFVSLVFVYEFLSFVNLKQIIKDGYNIHKKLFLCFTNKDFLENGKEEQMILKYSKQLLFTSLKIFGILFIILFFFLALNKISHLFIEFLISFTGIIEFSFIFFIYSKLRK